MAEIFNSSTWTDRASCRRSKGRTKKPRNIKLMFTFDDLAKLDSGTIRR
jgi:hypothetical protein